MLNDYEGLISILDSLGFEEYYKTSISTQRYEIDYGVQKGKVVSYSVKSVAENYKYDTNASSKDYMVNIDNELTILKCDQNDLDEKELFLQCVEIIDWGGVQTSNTMKAIKLASWILRCIAEIEFSTQTQMGFRQVDKAAFMLGFDILQIDESVEFT